MESRATIASFLLVGASNRSEISVRIGDGQCGASWEKEISKRLVDVGCLMLFVHQNVSNVFSYCPFCRVEVALKLQQI